MLLNEKDQNLSMSPKEGWGAYQDIVALTAKCRITGTWGYTCDFSHLAVAVHLFPFPNPKKDGGLEASLPYLLYMEYDSKHFNSSVHWKLSGRPSHTS